MTKPQSWMVEENLQTLITVHKSASGETEAVLCNPTRLLANLLAVSESIEPLNAEWFSAPGDVIGLQPTTCVHVGPEPVL